MKKLFLITLLLCFVGTFAACGKEKPEKENKKPKITSAPESVVDSSPEKDTEEAEDKDEVEAAGLPQLLSLQQTYTTRQDWQEEIRVLYSECSSVTVREGAEQYPELSRILSEKVGMQTRTMEDEADNILSFIKDAGMLTGDLTGFETQVSTSEAQVRRADSVVLSYLEDSYADYGFIEEFRGMWGSNYDVQTGKELMLSEVLLDMEAIPGIVLKELNEYIRTGDAYAETAVTNYFKNTPLDSIRWSLDYNGVTFYFGDGDISEAGNGGQTVTVSFAEYPNLFAEKYKNVPKAYMVRLPMDASFFTDLNGDGTVEELSCTGLFQKADRCYTQFGIYTNVDGYYHYEELFAYEFQPYYVKAEDGNHYLYLFCEEGEDGNLQKKLVVYNVNGGVVTRVGESKVAPAAASSDTFVVPLDPGYMLLDNYDNLAQGAEGYGVGKDGMPILK